MSSCSPVWIARQFEAIAERSVVIHGNRAILPVAAWVLEAGKEDVTAPDTSKGLAGQVPPNKALEALARLSEIGALAELPHIGRPHPRIFRKCASAPYWPFVANELAAFRAEVSPEAG